MPLIFQQTTIPKKGSHRAFEGENGYDTGNTLPLTRGLLYPESEKIRPK